LWLPERSPLFRPSLTRSQRPTLPFDSGFQYRKGDDENVASGKRWIRMVFEWGGEKGRSIDSFIQ